MEVLYIKWLYFFDSKCHIFAKPLKNESWPFGPILSFIYKSVVRVYETVSLSKHFWTQPPLAGDKLTSESVIGDLSNISCYSNTYQTPWVIFHGPAGDCHQDNQQKKQRRVIAAHSADRRQTHQIFADKQSNENGEEDAAKEPDDSEGVELFWVGPSLLDWLLIGQLTPQFHGVVETRQVLLKARARGAAEVIQ